MENNWDKFPNNICETLGPIERKPFTFNYGSFEVWQDNICIDSGESNGQIIGTINDNQLHVVIKDDLINSHIVERFKFGEISTNIDRIMWSKDIFNSKGKVQRDNPDISSLFFTQGVLSKVTYTIYDPNKLVEFYLADQDSEDDYFEDFDYFVAFTHVWNSNLQRDEKRAVAIQSDNLNNKGVQFYRNGNTVDAIPYFKEALSVMPNNDDALNNLRVCYLEIGDEEMANEMTKRLAYLSQ